MPNTFIFAKKGNTTSVPWSSRFAVFDEKDSLVDSRQRRSTMNVFDSQLPGVIKAGVSVDVAFQLQPGIYRIREIVTDLEDHQMTAFSRGLL
jgi:hypothetical protein